MATEWRIPKRGVFLWGLATFSLRFLTLRKVVQTTFIVGRATIVLCLVAVASQVQAHDLAGRVVSVHDGDTATVLEAGHKQYKIRLAGIDAPELHQEFGRVSQRHLSTAIQGKTVIVHWTKHDKYGRIVGTILLDDHDVNLGQLRAGLAWHYKRYEREQPPAERETYANAEAEARVAQLGLWQDAKPVPPWDYRKAKKADMAVPKTIN